MICCCEKCKFVFESIRLLDVCPDCAGMPVREATEAEKAEYRENRRRYGPMRTYGGVREVELPLVIGWDHGKPVYAKRGVMARFGPNGEFLGTVKEPGEIVRKLQ